VTVSNLGYDDPAVIDKRIHTNQRTISGNALEDQYVQEGESAYPTYTVIASGISVATSASHVLQIMADGTNYTRLKALRISLTDDVPASASALLIELYRLSTAGTGGSAVTPAPSDTADTYAGGAMTLPSSKGTEGAKLDQWRLWLPSAVAGGQRDKATWVYRPGMKPRIFGVATTAGIAFKVNTGVASATIDIVAEFITTSYL